MGSRRTRFVLLLAALAAIGLSIAGFVNAGTAKAGNVPNPVTGCSEDSFFAGQSKPDPATPIVTNINTDVTISTIYFDESPINTNPGFLPFYEVKDSGGNVVATGSPTQGPVPPGVKLDKYQTLLTATFQIPAKGTYTAIIKAWDGDQNKAGGDCGVAMWNVKTPDPGNLVLHKTDDHQPPNPLQGAVFGVWQGSTVAGNPLQTCTSLADGSCTFSGLDPDTYTVQETQAPPGYNADPSTATAAVTSNQTTDIAKPFVDPIKKGWVRVVKVLQDSTHAPVTVADKHVLDGASFVLYSDKNNSGALDPGEAAKLLPAETADATCTVSGGTGQCDIGPVRLGAYRIHETATPPNTTAGPDIDVTVVETTAANPTTVNYVNFVGDLNINLIKSGPSLAHVGDTFTYTFDASTTGPSLHNIQLAELAPNRCTTAISAASGDTNSNGFLDKGETWHWTCDHTVTAGDPNPLPNTAKVTGTDNFGRSVSAQDDHSVIIIHPSILVEKSGPAMAHEGDKITYTFKVTNTGDVALFNVAVNDDKLGVVGTTIASLSAKDSVTFTKDFTVPVGSSVDNIVTACGTDPLNLKVCDDDHHHLVIPHPAITVDKSGPAQAHEGDTVTYTFKVTNTGDVDLTNVAVTDNILGPIGTVGTLAKGASTTLTKDFKVPTPSTSAIVNTATACGDDPLQKEVCDHHDHHLDPIHPKIAIVKSGPALAHVGDTITYNFEVTNPGDVPLHNVVLTDPKCDSAPTIKAKTGTGDDVLDLEDHWFYTCDHTVTASDPDPLPNTGTVTGVDPLDKTVTANSSHTVDIIHPAIQVQKSGPAEAHEGDTVTYTFKVTNTGDVALSNVTAVDNVLGNVGTISSLDIGASTTLTKDFKVPSPSTGVDNTVTACGTDPLNLKVCDDDHHHLTPKHPAITVVKSGPATATANQTITYTFKITNTGDIDLKNVQATDDKLGNIGTVASLAVGESTTLTKNFTVPSGVSAVDNTVTACGTDTLSLQVCNTDKHHLDVTQVLGEHVVRQPLAVTGADLGWRSLIGLLLLVAGVGLRVMRRRNRRSEA